MASHVTNLATKYEDPKPIRSWVTCYNGCHWLALEMRTRPLRTRRITWPVSRGQKQLHIWNPRPIFAYSLYNFYLATTTIKGRLLSSRPMLKPLSGEKILSRRNEAQKFRFFWGGEMWVETLDFGFATPKRHFFARNRVVWCILRQNRCTRLGCSLSQEPKIAQSLYWREITHARKQTPQPIWIKFRMVVEIPVIVTYTNFGDHRLRGFWVAGVKFPPLPLTFIVALPCECVMTNGHSKYNKARDWKTADKMHNTH